MEKIFKAKRLDNGEWFEFSLFDGVSQITWEIFDKNTVCQYTGIKDSEGSKIFEGDELRASGEVYSLAVWKNSSFCIKHKTIHSSFVKFSDIDLSCYTLTGHNIHDKD